MARVLAQAASSPLRVAHIMAGAPQGGAELFFERLAIAQQGIGVNLAACIRANPARQARLAQEGVRTHEFRFGGPFDIMTRPALKRVLRQFSPTVTVAWMSRAAQKMPHGPWVSTARLGGYYDLDNYRRCRHLIGNTRGLTRWMTAQGWPARQVHYLPNFATDYAGVVPKRPDFVSPERPFMLALGRLHQNKAFDVLIRAAAHLPQLDLVIAGEGPERAALTALASKLGIANRVHLPGWVQETAPLLAACDMLVCPSRIEPLGNVVIEGFSAGKPVIGSAIQGPEELLTGTEDGLLFPVEDDRTLADRIGAVLGDETLSQNLGRNARARFEREFSAPTVLARWNDFFDRIAH